MTIDKRTWPRVRFGDVVRQVKDVVNPSTAGLERYIAGEHMDSDDLRIRRWGTIDGGYLGPAFHMRFRPGQVLYGSRRTYLRKVAVPDFEGICANTTFVLESKDPALLLPELLPFLMQTEAFNAHSIKQSKGSVNPYVNFSDLAWYEFALPPLEEQRRIANILLTVERQRESLDLAAASARLLRYSVEKSNYIEGKLSEEVFLGELLKSGTISLQTGPFGTVLKASSYTTSGYPVVNPSDMMDGRVVLDKCKFVDEREWRRLHQYQVQPGDVFIGRKGDMQNIVYVTPEFSGYIIGSDCIRFRIHDDTLIPEYLFYYLRADVTRQWLQAQAYGTTMPGISEKLLAKMPMELPDIETQQHVVDTISLIDRGINSCNSRKSQCDTMKSVILNSLHQ